MRSPDNPPKAVFRLGAFKAAYHAEGQEMAISMKQSSPASKAALLGILCAVAVALSFLEGLLPALPIPGAKLGLSNIYGV